MVGVGHVLLAEELGILTAEKFVEMLAGFGELFGARNEERVVGNVNDAFQMGHFVGVERGPYHVARKEDFGLRVVDNVVYLLSLELVEDGHDHCSVGKRSHEGY